MHNKILKTSYLFLIAVFAISFFYKNKLPGLSEINPDLLNEPVQTETAETEFSFSYREKNYRVLPQAGYELWGLIVSQNDIGKWYNYYHDENSVNLKDVCVVWGENIKSGVYLDENIKFKSGEWTCYYSWDRKLKNEFNPHQLSNNHLLSADENIQKEIRKLNIGDQIYLKGLLVDYREEEDSWFRKTSLSRNDTNQNSRSGGACEVFYVNKIETITKNNHIWNIANHWSKTIFYWLLALNIILFIYNGFKKPHIYSKKH